MRCPTNGEDFVTPLHLNYSMVRNILLLSLSQYLCIFSTHIMSECPFEGMFLLELPFWVRHIPFWGVGGGGVPLKCLKFFTNPVSFLRSLGPLALTPIPYLRFFSYLYTTYLPRFPS